MEKKLGSNVVQFPLRKRESAVDVLHRVVNEALEATECAPPVKPPVRRRSTRAAQIIKGDNNTQMADTATRSQSITGNGNVQVSGNLIVQTELQAPRRPASAPVPPPPDHITEEQAAILKRLHDEWVALSAAVKTKAKPITGQQAWVDINRVGHCTTYKHMRQVHFDTACAFVKQQMAILRSGKTARRRDPKWRSSRIGAIKARCINQLGDEYAYRPYIVKNFRAQSLTELDDEQLEATYRHALTLKLKTR